MSTFAESPEYKKRYNHSNHRYERLGSSSHYVQQKASHDSNGKAPAVQDDVNLQLGCGASYSCRIEHISNIVSVFKLARLKKKKKKKKWIPTYEAT